MKWLWNRHRNELLIAYALGNALTYAYLVKGQAGSVYDGASLSDVMFEALFLSFIWPIYWLGWLLR